MKHNVKCASGLTGWQGHLQENYGSFEEFSAYSEMYGLHSRLGYETPEEAWEQNPVVQGSVNPSDYQRVE